METEVRVHSGEEAFSDNRPTSKQIEIAEWLGQFKGATVPQECYDDWRAWKRWIKGLIDRVDLDIANEMRIDFGLHCDFHDPVSIIGCLKYYDKVQTSEVARSELQRQRAKELLIAGVDPYLIADQFEMSDQVLFEIVREIEREEHLIVAI